jgi:hypothetical protein
MSTHVDEMETEMTTLTATVQPRPIGDVVRDVARWQAAIICGRDPGATPVGETGWPLSRLAARTYFGADVLDGEACALA